MGNVEEAHDWVISSLNHVREDVALICEKN